MSDSGDNDDSIAVIISKHNIIANMIAGAVAGVMEMVLMYPIDTVKVIWTKWLTVTDSSCEINILNNIFLAYTIFLSPNSVIL